MSTTAKECEFKSLGNGFFKNLRISPQFKDPLIHTLIALPALIAILILLYYTSNIYNLFNSFAYIVPIFIVAMNSDKTIFKLEEKDLMYPILLATVLIFLFSLPTLMNSVDVCPDNFDKNKSSCSNGKTLIAYDVTYLHFKKYTLKYCAYIGGALVFLAPFLSKLTQKSEKPPKKIYIFCSILLSLFLFLSGYHELNIVHDLFHIK